MATEALRCEPDARWTNYPATQDLIPLMTCTPESLADVVATIRAAEANGKHVRPVGSSWSFSDCARTRDYLVDTRRLDRELQSVGRALKPGVIERRLYHVEAGITIRKLYENLDRLGLALKTMGGASGQTLAGAISTGTHGGDKRLPPLADSVVAIHLVGHGGRQFWIERSSGITDPSKLRESVVPRMPLRNIIYDDATFDACLVSLGAMGVIYAVVLRVRNAYDLVERTVATTWKDFKSTASTRLSDTSARFLQVLVSPYPDINGDNLCLVTTRSEATPTGTVTRPTGDTRSAVETMVRSMTLGAQTKVLGILDPTLSDEEQLARVVQLIISETDQRGVLVQHYGNILRSGDFTPGTFRGASFSVMDVGYAKPPRSTQPGYSIELHFPATAKAGEAPYVDFVDALIALVSARVRTFFAGYVSLRFVGRTRASLGMQQWRPTCAVEISCVQGVDGLLDLLSDAYKVGVELGGLPHWGQMVDLRVQGNGRVYPRYSDWRTVYARMSNDYATRTFESWLTHRWKLTTPSPEPAPDTDRHVVVVPEAQSFVSLDALVEAGTVVALQPDPGAKITSGVLFHGETGPEGYPGGDRDPKFPLKASPYRPYALLYRFVPDSNDEGEVPWRYLGANETSFVAQEPGRVLFRTNDDSPGNGSGAFRVVVTTESS